MCSGQVNTKHVMGISPICRISSSAELCLFTGAVYPMYHCLSALAGKILTVRPSEHLVLIMDEL